MVVRKEADTLMVICVAKLSTIWMSCVSYRMTMLSGPSCNKAAVTV